MFSPETRTVAMDLLRPPPGYTLDTALLTTYSLDLDTLLALPLAILARTDGGLDELLEDPFRLLTALREAAERVHCFVDRAGIAAPRIPRALFTLLEPCVHAVAAPGGGAFHPKLWLARFTVIDQPADEAGPERAPVLLRVAVLSRNLTADRSWDLALASEAAPFPRQRFAAARPLAELVQALPGLCLQGFPKDTAARLAALADELERSRFPAPPGAEGMVRFHCLGVGAEPAVGWPPIRKAGALLAMAPFLDQKTLQPLAAVARRSRTLISRADALDELPAAALDAWDKVMVLSDAADGEVDDEDRSRPSGLHAKAIGFEHGASATWLVGSANLTQAAFLGRNVEVVAEITGPRRSGDGGLGLTRFEAGVEPLCLPYVRQELEPGDADLLAAKGDLDEACRVLAEAALKLTASPVEDEWALVLDGAVQLPPEVRGVCWPISIHGDDARALRLPMRWRLPGSRLTAFVAFRLFATVGTGGAEAEQSLTLKVPAEGLPDERFHEILRVLIDSPERLLRFLRALLGGFDALMEWGAEPADAEDKHGRWSSSPDGWSDAAVLEDLVRAAARDPARLAPARRLLADLCASEEGRRLLPDGLLELWQAVDEALGIPPEQRAGAAER